MSAVTHTVEFRPDPVLHTRVEIEAFTDRRTMALDAARDICRGMSMKAYVRDADGDITHYIDGWGAVTEAS